MPVRSNHVAGLTDFKNNDTVRSVVHLCDMFAHLLFY